MGATQPSLFADEELAPKAYVLNPQHVRNRLQGMLEAMRAGTSWPWDASTVRFYRETVWPSLCSKLPDAAEAERWRGLIEAEIVRLEST